MTPPRARRDWLAARQPFIVFAVLLGIVFGAKMPVLSTPYHWDEVGWIGCAHRLWAMHLWQVLPGLHRVLYFEGRPPGLLVTAAGLFDVFGPSIWLPHFLTLCFAFLGVWSTYRLGR